jgi:hypothetical protein
MAGRRRTRSARGVDGTVRASATTRRAEAIKAKMLGRYAEAQSAPERLAVACDYARSAAAFARRVDPIRTEHTLDEVVRRLLHAGGELLELGGRRT